MTIDNNLINKLFEGAKESPRLRMNYDLRNSVEDKSQRMLNALLPGTPLPIHRHRTTSETVVILKGCMKEIFYDDNGKVTDVFTLKPQSDCMGLSIPKGQWHTVEVLEPSVIMEVKDGAYQPIIEEDIMVASINSTFETES